MRRRAFLSLLGGAVAALPLAARAQQSGKIARVGFLGPSLNSPQPMALYQALLAQLRELGFIEGQNLTADYRGLDDPRGSIRQCNGPYATTAGFDCRTRSRSRTASGR